MSESVLQKVCHNAISPDDRDLLLGRPLEWSVRRESSGYSYSLDLKMVFITVALLFYEELNAEEDSSEV